MFPSVVIDTKPYRIVIRFHFSNIAEPGGMRYIRNEVYNATHWPWFAHDEEFRLLHHDYLSMMECRIKDATSAISIIPDSADICIFCGSVSCYANHCPMLDCELDSDVGFENLLRGINEAINI